MIDRDINAIVTQLFEYCRKQPFEGLIEAVPAYASLTLFYDVLRVRKVCSSTETAYTIAVSYLSTALKNLSSTKLEENRQIEIPVIYDGEDLTFVANHNRLSIEEVIEIHSQCTYRVYMIGFLPGFAYLGGMDDRIASPRKSTPRTKVPVGSVGIAGNQTGIYPFESPGGWQLIGRTSLPLFNMGSPEPSLLNIGDLVRFVRKKE